MTKKIAINRRTTVGFGYTSACERGKHGLQVCEVEAPDHIGTIGQVSEAIDNDRTLASFHGGTYYRTAWFVKVDGQWLRVRDEQYLMPLDLLEREDRSRASSPYEYQSIEVEVES